MTKDAAEIIEQELNELREWKKGAIILLKKCVDVLGDCHAYHLEDCVQEFLDKD